MGRNEGDRNRRQKKFIEMCRDPTIGDCTRPRQCALFTPEESFFGNIRCANIMGWRKRQVPAL